MILQLDPPLPMDTVRGTGLAHFMIDYGPESHLMWVVFMDADGACWTVPNPEVRMQANWSMQRRPGRRPFERPPAPPAADPSHAGLNGHAPPEGVALNGASPTGASPNGARVNGASPIRYDAAPAA